MRNFTELEAARKRLMIAQFELEAARESYMPSLIREAMADVEYWRGQCRALAMPDPIVVVVQQPSQPAEPSPEYQPWTWFKFHTSITGSTLRDATQADRKIKRVGFKLDADGQKLYSVDDARRNWPDQMTPRKKK